MRWVRTRRRKRLQAMLDQVVDEAERLLAGQLLDPKMLCRRRVPAWTLIAALGHARREDLCSLAARDFHPDPAHWGAALALLASATVELAEDDTALLRLQRAALIPLELSLLGREVPSPTTPIGIIHLVRRTIHTPLLPGT
jgi:hypothetical protein